MGAGGPKEVVLLVCPEKGLGGGGTTALPFVCFSLPVLKGMGLKQMEKRWSVLFIRKTTTPEKGSLKKDTTTKNMLAVLNITRALLNSVLWGGVRGHIFGAQV